MSPERSTAYFDAHNHWKDPGFDQDHAEIIASLKPLNIKCMVVNGTTETDWSQVQALAGSDPSIIPCFGIHPGSPTRVLLDGFDHWSGLLLPPARRLVRPGWTAIYRITISQINELTRIASLRCSSFSAGWWWALRRVR